MPEVPTIAEAGVPGYEFSSWFGLFAPAGTPREIVSRLQVEAAKAMAQPEVRDRLPAMGNEAVGSTPEQFTAKYQSDIAKYAAVVKRGVPPRLISSCRLRRIASSRRNAELTLVGFGTPMGEVLRPTGSRSAALRPRRFPSSCDPRRRSVASAQAPGVGVLVSLAHSRHLSRIRPRGRRIRCCYHGWLTRRRTMLEQPGSRPTAISAASLLPAYPAREFAASVRLHGPARAEPVFPRFESSSDGVALFAYRNITAGPWPSATGCIPKTPWTLTRPSCFDHQRSSSPTSTRPCRSSIREPRRHEYIRPAKLPSGRTFVRVQEAFTPNMRSIADNLTPDRPHAESATLVGWWVPVDDSHTIGFHIETVDPQDKEKISTFARAKEGRTAGTQEKHRSYEDTQRHPDDKEAQLSQRPIALHALERLGTTDRGVIMFRKLSSARSRTWRKAATRKCFASEDCLPRWFPETRD